MGTYRLSVQVAAPPDRVFDLSGSFQGELNAFAKLVEDGSA
ncbi:MAG TPA: hypothetical protein VEX41_11165 [Candidatus Eisenbacteria bacterium]|nr:hypothetical protein [Candidatus Eisenbacteria bacterium]